MKIFYHNNSEHFVISPANLLITLHLVYVLQSDDKEERNISLVQHLIHGEPLTCKAFV